MIEQVLWLSLCVYFEARGEPPSGQEAVVHVILNRAAQRHKTVVEIIKQPGQFSWLSDDIPDHVKDFRAFAQCIRSVYNTFKKRLDGDTFDGINHYYNPYLVEPSWSASMQVVAKIGNHIFLRD